MNTDNSKKIVTRFAPSPTGFMHIGGVRTALFAYLFARKNNGTFILRIEDTDKKREVPGSIEHIQESLTWLGINWDYGPNSTDTPFGSCIQSERLPIYLAYAQKLIDKGYAYADPYTTEEVEAFKATAIAEKRPFLYRDHRPENPPKWDGSMPLRLRVPEIKRYTWNDAVRGELSAGEEMLDDVVLIKADGYPTYNFAHIVDDHEMGVTHIMRGDEFISSTPKFLSIYDALDIPYPVFATLPPILRDDRTKKLGKRDGAKDILDYRAEGYLPQTMMNFLALVGWNPGTDTELLTKEELISQFSLEKIQRAGAAFNEEKLLWMNKQYLNKIDNAEFRVYINDAISPEVRSLPQFSEARLEKIIPRIREHTSVRTDVTEAIAAGEYQYIFDTPIYEVALLSWKNDPSVMSALERLEAVRSVLTEADFESIDTVKAAIWPLTEQYGRGEVLWPLRVALSGKSQSPDPFTLAYTLGYEETLARISAACDKISG